MHSPLSSPPQPHTGNDNRDTYENYYIDVHDGSCTLLELPPPKTMDEILPIAVVSMIKLIETYNVQGDIDNFIIRVPEIFTNDDTNDNAWEPYEESEVYTVEYSKYIELSILTAVI
ncbi:hypothetical protein BDD12DRAFT_892945 [Trichophaea hybrida]|nr:hypothetical protein BDD12DRAFT_892945 [Trichophaea hybrida]